MTEVQGHESNQTPPPMSGLLERARVLGSEGAYDEMLETIQQVMALSPQLDEEFQAFLLRARALEGLGQTEQALADVEWAVNRMPGNQEALLLRAGVLRDLGRPDEALADIERALVVGPDSHKTYLLRAGVLRDMGRLDEALGAVDRAITLSTESGDVFQARLLRAGVLGDLGRLEEALEEIQQAIVLEPDSQEALLLRARVLRDLGQVQEALAVTEQVLDLEPDSQETLLLWANELQELGHVEEALEATDQVIVLDPDSHEAFQALLLRAGMVREAGQQQEALALLERAVELQPDNQEALRLRADLLREMGHPEPSPPVAPELLGGGYDADEADDSTRVDALGVTDDVKMVCSVLADRKARPPLSVGLFGEWGSGKSFFMRLMRQRIEKLAEVAYDAERAKRETRYCSHVVQITFNAWHYMDANLWASLAVEIFNRLATPAPPGRPAPSDLDKERERIQTERSRVLQRLETYQRLVAELSETHERAEQERKRVEQELAVATKRRESTARRLAAVMGRDLAARLDKDPELTGLRTEAAKQLRMSELPAGELPELVSDLRKISGQAGFVWRLLMQRKGSWTFGLAVVFVIALLVGLVVLATPESQGVGAGSIAVSLAAMAGLVARVRPTVAAVQSGLGLAEAGLRRANSLERQYRERRTKWEVQLAAKLKGLAAQEEGLAVQLAEATTKAAEAEAEMEDLRAGRRLQRFLQERSGSSDYRRHLGLISLLHQDFRQLSALLQSAQTSEQEGSGEKEGDGEALPRIDRVILYVDDLDRCPPARVVEVLQAMHLLLALPLFVVVVGVDPRWLLRSLQRHYRALLTAPAAERAVSGDVSQWASTPQNYLEKIFQIPFALAPMTGAGFARLVDDLAVPPPDQPTAHDQIARLQPPGGDQKGGLTPAEQEQTPTMVAGSAGDQDPATPQMPEPATTTINTTETTKPAGQEDSPFDSEAMEPVVSSSESPAGKVEPTHPDPQLAELQRITLEPGSVASPEHDIDPNPTGLTITDNEIRFIQGLAPMVTTPRAGKRLVNIYRMIRSTQATGGHSRFLSREPDTGSDYRAVLQLLAIISGFPHLAAPTFTALLQAPPSMSWQAFVDELLPDTKPPYHNKVGGRLSESLATEWRRLHDGLVAVRNTVDVPDELRPYQEWAPRVARFSFTSGRLLGDGGMIQSDRLIPEDTPGSAAKGEAGRAR